MTTNYYIKHLNNEIDRDITKIQTLFDRIDTLKEIIKDEKKSIELLKKYRVTLSRYVNTSIEIETNSKEIAYVIAKRAYPQQRILSIEELEQ